MQMEMNMIPCFGIAGNFTGHLEQAGEDKDFRNMKTSEQNAPKAIFPTFIPKKTVESSAVPTFLHTFPFSNNVIEFPKAEEKLQIEPECAIFCNVQWDGQYISNITPVSFAASNDCSIRKDGANKISEKKNWGAKSKGVSDNQISIDKFDSNGILKNYRIASFLVRNNEIFDYGEDSAVSDYSYIYEKLLVWMKDKFNNQKCEGPAEDIHSYLICAEKPQSLMVSIGATRYTEFGKTNFLKTEDDAVVVVYPCNKYSHEDIKQMALNKDFSDKEVSFLYQKIVK